MFYVHIHELSQITNAMLKGGFLVTKRKNKDAKNLLVQTGAIADLEVAGQMAKQNQRISAEFAEELSDGGERNEMAEQQAKRT